MEGRKIYLKGGFTLKIYIIIIIIVAAIYALAFNSIKNIFKRLESGDMKVKGQDEFEAKIEDDIKKTEERIEQEETENKDER